MRKGGRATGPPLASAHKHNTHPQTAQPPRKQFRERDLQAVARRRGFRFTTITKNYGLYIDIQYRGTNP